MNQEETKIPPGDFAAFSLKRREFLQLLAASFAALAGCKIKTTEEKLAASMAPPEESVPGRSLWYAATCQACPALCGALAKVRDGRPIKLEGDPEHPVSRGGLCARGQASLLDLYDSQRYAGPLISGRSADWAEADRLVISALEKARAEGKACRLLTGTWASPTARAGISRLRSRFPDLRQVVYDEPSLAASLAAHELTHGRRALPSYHLEKAGVIVSFDADFLGTWGSPVQYARDWASRRKPGDKKNPMSWHAQFEARLSPTGAGADLRVPLRPSERYGTLAALGRLVAKRTGWSGPLPPAGATGVSPELLERTAGLLAENRRKAVLLCGACDTETQVLANWLNHMLGAYEGIADLARQSGIAGGGQGSFDGLLGELDRGEVAVLVVRGCNPSQDHPRAAEFRRAAPKAGLFVSLSGQRDETSALAGIICPEHHYLESWADHDAHPGLLGLSQPAISPLRDTRDALETLARWAGRKGTALDLLKEHWRAEVFHRLKKSGGFDKFWDSSVQSGKVVIEDPAKPAVFSPAALRGLRAPAAPGEGFEFAAYAGVALGTGLQANNPWLQELPDPVTKTTWGNVASFSPVDAGKLGLVEGRAVRLSAGGVSLELPAHIQPGQAPGVIVSALGYGRSGIGPIAGNFPTEKLLPVDFEPAGGADVMPLFGASGVKVEVLDRFERLAKTQRYDYLTDPLMGKKRDLVRETSLAAYAADPRAGNLPEPGEHSLWPGHEYKGHRWAMAIDLNACTGCSGCVVACNLENNVPVVGKAEVAKSRDMHWLRIDRYYSGAPGGGESSPEVVFQPMLCQHCDNAPCETVCPVLATLHSEDGLSMQVYNRCVGTRYCENNCPYKVRRFNWFDYAHKDLMRNLALNPDVTVRGRGVMEKCSFCVQRIFAAKGEAKAEGRGLRDGEVLPACAQSCPAGAIVFGDLNDPGSRVAKLASEGRAYRLLAEIGTRPAVRYLTKVRNKRI